MEAAQKADQLGRGWGAAARAETFGEEVWEGLEAQGTGP